ncbi:tyrosinase cofactor [Streptomyces bambusae]|uniref:apotyrosinase chaperone MelC1 n=1 Tax=Streptomyces bambusae TaxID=1550616 RepID=UPI001CFEF599|nr:tyrosinase cofactor [Streptomyces bambusae]MCB5165750.1 tyrosinase cofactor [Streptomyces bambusae]
MSQLTRRRALMAGAGTLAALGTAAAARAVAAGDPAHSGHAATTGADHSGHGAAAAPASFDEVFQGRRIKGAPDPHAGHGGHHGVGYTVTVDGRELHVMRNADGSWISVVNHYETFATPRALARAAVTELQGAALVPLQTF